MKQPVTREQLASILYRLSGKPAASASLRSYTDAADVSAYAVDAMRWAVGCGYLKGKRCKAESPDRREPRRGCRFAAPVPD